jgi:hypothetical protein
MGGCIVIFIELREESTAGSGALDLIAFDQVPKSVARRCEFPIATVEKDAGPVPENSIAGGTALVRLDFIGTIPSEPQSGGCGNFPDSAVSVSVTR